MRNTITQRLTSVGLGRTALKVVAVGLALAGCRDEPTPTGIRRPASVVLKPSFATVATTPTMGTTPPLTRSTVNNRPGKQFDPHISGSRLAYTGDAPTGVVFGVARTEVHHHDLSTGADAVVPPQADATDWLPRHQREHDRLHTNRA